MASYLWTGELLAGPPTAAALNGVPLPRPHHESECRAPVPDQVQLTASPHPNACMWHVPSYVARRWPYPARLQWHLMCTNDKEGAEKEMPIIDQVLTYMMHAKCLMKCASGSFSTIFGQLRAFFFFLLFLLGFCFKVSSLTERLEFWSNLVCVDIVIKYRILYWLIIFFFSFKINSKFILLIIFLAVIIFHCKLTCKSFAITFQVMNI